MNPLNFEQVYGLALSAVTFLLMAAVVEVEAAPIFPPPHHDVAVFQDEARVPSAQPVAQPWYRSGVVVQAPIVDKSQRAELGGTPISSTIGVTPWYRAAN